MTRANIGTDGLLLPGSTDDERQRLTDQGKLGGATTARSWWSPVSNPGRESSDMACCASICLQCCGISVPTYR